MEMGRIRPPHTLASISGWMGAALLAGIILHSLAPDSAVSMTALSFIAAFSVLFALFFGRRMLWLRVVALCVLAAAIGVWRFEVARPSMPRGLAPFTASGLAYSSNGSDTTDSPFSRSRQVITATAQRLFPPDEAGLLTGVLYGERLLPQEVKNQFRRAGLMHIIAVSGSNVTIVVVMVMAALSAFHLSRRRSFIAITIALVAFVLFVGPTASVIRAAIMGWLIEFAPLVGRVPRPSRLLLVSAVVFSFWHPWSLLFDASFALSFLAMWGLLTFSRAFSERLQKRITNNFVRETVAMSLGATMMTLPYSAWAFGQLTVWSVVTSLAALPLVSWITVTGILALALPFVPYIALPARGFLQILLWIGRWPDAIPVGVWTNLSTPFSWMIAVYFIWFVIWRELQRKKRVIHSSVAIPEEKRADLT